MKQAKKLLSSKDIAEEYNLGLVVSRWLTHALPAIRVGRRILVRREDVEEFLTKAAAEGWDIQAIAREAYMRAKGKAPARTRGAP